jgi:hypothetical protein
VLGRIDPHGKLVSADALHTGKATAEFIHQGGGQFVLPVKENRKALFDAIDALPWHEPPVAQSATDRGHGRITTRTIQVPPAPEDLPFPTSGRSCSSSGTLRTCMATRSRRWPRLTWPAPPCPGQRRGPGLARP